MNPKVFGWQHLIYLVICLVLAIVGIVCAKKFAKTEKLQKIILKLVALLLFVSILINRLSLVFVGSTPNWKLLIPGSFCGMSSLVLSVAVLFGKKDNCVLHFVWLIAILGGIITLIYPDFIGQNESFFYLTTISGLIHHTLSVLLVILLLMFKQIHITYKKWYCTIFGFTCYFSVGAFLISVFNYSDAFNIMSPILSGTPFTAWVMAPIYLMLYAIILLLVELFRRVRTNKLNKANK